MKIQRLETADQATLAAADWLTARLLHPGVQNVMVAGGHTPLKLYSEIARRQLSLEHLRIFALDEYVGVPREEPRNCANLIRESVVQSWRIPADHYHEISSLDGEALPSIIEHERKIEQYGGLDVVILGLGCNGHIGFNEPGRGDETFGGLIELDEVSIQANRKWFEGKYAPSMGVTTGMKAILSSRSILLLAFGSHKANAVEQMCHGKVSANCPASYLQRHDQAFLFLDRLASVGLASQVQSVADGIKIGGALMYEMDDR